MSSLNKSAVINIMGSIDSTYNAEQGMYQDWLVVSIGDCELVRTEISWSDSQREIPELVAEWAKQAWSEVMKGLTQ